MPGRAARSRRRHLPLAAALAALVTGTAAPVRAAAPAVEPSASTPARSALDALLFYQLLLGEMELRSGQPGIAFEVVLDAAKRVREDQLFRHAVEIALQSRVGEKALDATKAWRSTLPESAEALRWQLQILVALNRMEETAEPLRALLARTPVADRNGLIASLPGFYHRAGDAGAAARLLEDTLAPYAAAAATQVATQTALARQWLAAGDTERALALAEKAHAAEASAPGPVLVAMELMAKQPRAERIVESHLRGKDVEPPIRLAYVRVLMQGQRYAEAIRHLEDLTRTHPDLAPPWLTLGALHVELKQPTEGERALQRYLELAGRDGGAASSAASADDGDERGEGDSGRVQAWLLLAQAAELRRDYPAAEAWLARIDSPQRALEVQTRRATLLARQGRVDEARALVRQLPVRAEGDARNKLVAEAQMLREVKRWRDAYDVLGEAVKQSPEDIELLYEQAMMAEKLQRLDEMERLLRRVMTLKPDHQHAYNALGYSLADRGLRLAEARELIRKALDLAPGDPFITDSLGWVEFRLGNRDKAIELLKQAYAARPDTEIAAHLGEVLWVSGQRDEARRVWREGRARDAANETLRETLARLKPDL
jgi:tetratricopeptide (TPR) repeat protein